jgi:hypothetical protein
MSSKDRKSTSSLRLISSSFFPADSILTVESACAVQPLQAVAAVVLHAAPKVRAVAVAAAVAATDRAAHAVTRARAVVPGTPVLCFALLSLLFLVVLWSPSDFKWCWVCVWCSERERRKKKKVSGWDQPPSALPPTAALSNPVLCGCLLSSLFFSFSLPLWHRPSTVCIRRASAN